jgi:hypothetical protein
MPTGHTELLLIWVAKGPRAKEGYKWWKAPSSAKHIPEPDDEDDELHEVLEVSRHETEFQRMVREHYEHGGGNGGGRGWSRIKGLFRRCTPQRERSKDFDVARAKAPVQTRIDISPWTSKGKSAKEAIGWVWLKWFYVSGVPGKNVDNPYFISAVKQTQQWGIWLALYYYGIVL